MGALYSSPDGTTPETECLPPPSTDGTTAGSKILPPQSTGEEDPKRCQKTSVDSGVVSTASPSVTDVEEEDEDIGSDQKGELIFEDGFEVIDLDAAFLGSTSSETLTNESFTPNEPLEEFPLTTTPIEDCQHVELIEELYSFPIPFRFDFEAGGKEGDERPTPAQNDVDKQLLDRHHDRPGRPILSRVGWFTVIEKEEKEEDNVAGKDGEDEQESDVETIEGEDVLSKEMAVEDESEHYSDDLLVDGDDVQTAKVTYADGILREAVEQTTIRYYVTVDDEYDDQGGSKCIDNADFDRSFGPYTVTYNSDREDYNGSDADKCDCNMLATNVMHVMQEGNVLQTSSSNSGYRKDCSTTSLHTPAFPQDHDELVNYKCYKSDMIDLKNFKNVVSLGPEDDIQQGDNAVTQIIHNGSSIQKGEFSTWIHFSPNHSDDENNGINEVCKSDENNDISDASHQNEEEEYFIEQEYCPMVEAYEEDGEDYSIDDGGHKSSSKDEEHKTIDKNDLPECNEIIGEDQVHYYDCYNYYNSSIIIAEDINREEYLRTGFLNHDIVIAKGGRDNLTAEKDNHKKEGDVPNDNSVTETDGNLQDESLIKENVSKVDFLIKEAENSLQDCSRVGVALEADILPHSGYHGDIYVTSPGDTRISHGDHDELVILEYCDIDVMDLGKETHKEPMTLQDSGEQTQRTEDISSIQKGEYNTWIQFSPNHSKDERIQINVLREHDKNDDISNPFNENDDGEYFIEPEDCLMVDAYGGDGEDSSIDDDDHKSSSKAKKHSSQNKIIDDDKVNSMIDVGFKEKSMNTGHLEKDSLTDEDRRDLLIDDIGEDLIGEQSDSVINGEVSWHEDDKVDFKIDRRWKNDVVIMGNEMDKSVEEAVMRKDEIMLTPSEGQQNDSVIEENECEFGLRIDKDYKSPSFTMTQDELENNIIVEDINREEYLRTGFLNHDTIAIERTEGGQDSLTAEEDSHKRYSVVIAANDCISEDVIEDNDCIHHFVEEDTPYNLCIEGDVHNDNSVIETDGNLQDDSSIKENVSKVNFLIEELENSSQDSSRVGVALEADILPHSGYHGDGYDTSIGDTRISPDDHGESVILEYCDKIVMDLGKDGNKEPMPLQESDEQQTHRTEDVSSTQKGEYNAWNQFSHNQIDVLHEHDKNDDISKTFYQNSEEEYLIEQEDCLMVDAYEEEEEDCPINKELKPSIEDKEHNSTNESDSHELIGEEFCEWSGTCEQYNCCMMEEDFENWMTKNVLVVDSSAHLAGDSLTDGNRGCSVLDDCRDEVIVDGNSRAHLAGDSLTDGNKGHSDDDADNNVIANLIGSKYENNSVLVNGESMQENDCRIDLTIMETGSRQNDPVVMDLGKEPTLLYENDTAIQKAEDVSSIQKGEYNTWIHFSPNHSDDERIQIDVLREHHKNNDINKTFYQSGGKEYLIEQEDCLMVDAYEEEEEECPINKELKPSSEDKEHKSTNETDSHELIGEEFCEWSGTCEQYNCCMMEEDFQNWMTKNVLVVDASERFAEDSLTHGSRGCSVLDDCRDDVIVNLIDNKYKYDSVCVNGDSLQEDDCKVDFSIMENNSRQSHSVVTEDDIVKEVEYRLDEITMEKSCEQQNDFAVEECEYEIDLTIREGGSLPNINDIIDQNISRLGDFIVEDNNHVVGSAIERDVVGQGNSITEDGGHSLADLVIAENDQGSDCIIEAVIIDNEDHLIIEKNNSPVTEEGDSFSNNPLADMNDNTDVDSVAEENDNGSDLFMEGSESLQSDSSVDEDRCRQHRTVDEELDLENDSMNMEYDDEECEELEDERRIEGTLQHCLENDSRISNDFDEGWILADHVEDETVSNSMESPSIIDDCSMLEEEFSSSTELKTMCWDSDQWAASSYNTAITDLTLEDLSYKEISQIATMLKDKCTYNYWYTFATALLHLYGDQITFSEHELQDLYSLYNGDGTSAMNFLEAMKSCQPKYKLLDFRIAAIKLKRMDIYMETEEWSEQLLCSLPHEKQIQLANLLDRCSRGSGWEDLATLVGFTRDEVKHMHEFVTAPSTELMLRLRSKGGNLKLGCLCHVFDGLSRSDIVEVIERFIRRHDRTR